MPVKKQNRKKAKINLNKDGILVYIEQVPALSEEDAIENKEKVLAIAKDMKKPKRLLLDLTDIEMPTSRARKHLAEMTKKTNWDKLGIFGVNIAIRTMAKFILSAAGLKNFKFFDTRDEALKWLKE